MFSNSLLISNWIMDGVKSIFFWIDKGVYSLVKVVYEVFYTISNAALLNPEIVETFTKKIYAIVGIVMLFVMAFNLLNYIVDPDKINDKKTGATAMIKDIVIALVVITLLPTIFTQLYGLQAKLLNSNVIANIILGGYAGDESSTSYEDYKNSGENNLTSYYIHNGANLMVANVYSAFLSPNEDFTVLDCDGVDEGIYEDYCDAYRTAKTNGKINEYEDFVANDNYSFIPLLSTVGGLVLLFFMLSFCINLGKRAGTMALLQLIAPVPVLMEILPNKKGTRKTWLDMLIKSFLEVFFFQLIIYVVIFLISLIPDVVNGLFIGQESSGFIRLVSTVLLIFGLLQFGKEAPQMIFDILGIKSTGVIKAAAQRAYRMAGAGAAGIGTSATSLTRSIVNGVRDGDISGGVLRGLASGTTGLFRGAYDNRTGGFRGIGGRVAGSVNRTMSNQGRIVGRLSDYLSAVRGEEGTGNRVRRALQPVGAPIANWATGGTYESQNRELQSYKSYNTVFDSAKIKTSSDERYMSYQKQLDQVLADNGMVDFYDVKKAWMKDHKGATLNDFLASAEGAKYMHAYDEITTLSSAMDARETAMKADKKDDLIVAVAQAKALLASNRDVADAYNSMLEGIKSDERDKFDINKINISSDSSEADIIAAYDALKKLNSEVNDKSTAIKADIAAQQMRRDNRNNGGGSGGGH